MWQKVQGIFLIVGIVLLISGCSGETKGNKRDQSEGGSKDVEKVNIDTDVSKQTEVALMIHWGEDAFEDYFNQYVKEALPHIKLTYIQGSEQKDIEDNFAKGLVPDLVMGSNFQMYHEVDLALDQMPLIEKHGLDLNRLDQNIVDSLKNASSEGEMLALPLFRPDYLMGYNKDIFDAFGVPYPTDNMTWDEVIELGRQLTGEINEEQYHGLWPDREQLSQVGSTLINAETNEPNILENKDLRLFLERQEEIFNIPGNLPEMDSVEELAEFMYKGAGTHDLILNYALVPGRGPLGYFSQEENGGLNFDTVTYPVWGDEYPDYIPNQLYHNIFVTSQSENPDAAFEVIQYFLSDEFQKQSMAEGRITPLVSEEVRGEYGKQLDYQESLEEKNWQAIFTVPGAPLPDQSVYEGSIREQLLINAYQGLLEGKDVNTVLRVMDEEAQGILTNLKEKE